LGSRVTSPPILKLGTRWGEWSVLRSSRFFPEGITKDMGLYMRAGDLVESV